MKYVRNPEGAVHSVPDDWQIPNGADDAPQQGWEFVKEKDAPAELKGSTDGEQLDPAVNAVEIHDNGRADDPTNPDGEGVPDNGLAGDIGQVPEHPEVADPGPAPKRAPARKAPAKGKSA